MMFGLASLNPMCVSGIKVLRDGNECARIGVKYPRLRRLAINSLSEAPQIIPRAASSL